MDADERCRREVEELHAFFEGWFNDDLPMPDDAFKRFEDALDDSFEIVTPDGVERPKPEIVELVRGAHSTRKSALDPRIAPKAPVRIRVVHRGRRPLGQHLHLVVYEEWQSHASAEKGRISTALLTEVHPTRHRPYGLAWLHVQETWIQ